MPSIAGGAVNLNSLGGNINAVVNTAYVTANTTGSGGVGLTSQSSLLIGPSSAGTVFQAGSAAGLSVVGTITAPSIQLFPGTNVPSAATSLSAVIPQSPSQATVASVLVATFAPIVAFNSGTLLPTDLTPWSKETTVDQQNSSGDRPLVGSVNTTGASSVGMFRGSTFTGESLPALSSVATLKPGGSDNTLVLEAGSVLFAPTAPITVIVRDVAVDMKAGSVALISADSDSVAVFNLHDDYPGDVSVSTKKRSLDLMPGQEAVFSKSVSGFEQIGIATQVGFREVQSLDFGEGQSFIADFSILRALQLSSLREQLSARNSDGKSLFNKILKSAACVHLTRAAHGNYR